MEFAALIPLIIIGVVIAMVRRSVEQQKKQEAQRRAAARQFGDNPNVPPITRQTINPIRPSVQASSVPEGETMMRPGVGSLNPVQTPMQPRLHTDHEFCALNPEKPAKTVSGQKHPQHDDCALRADDPKGLKPVHTATGVPALHIGGSELRFTPNEVVRGVLFSEIFGKPKALQ